MKRILVPSLLLLVALLVSCGGGTASSTTAVISTSSTSMPGSPAVVEGGGTYWVITAAQLHGFQTKDFFLADTDADYVGEIASTDLFIKPANISQELDKFPADKTTKIVLYCTSGIQSQAAAVTLVKAGYTRVMELSGGIMGWEQQGYPTSMKTRTMM